MLGRDELPDSKRGVVIRLGAEEIYVADLDLRLDPRSGPLADRVRQHFLKDDVRLCRDSKRIPNARGIVRVKFQQAPKFGQRIIEAIASEIGFSGELVIIRHHRRKLQQAFDGPIGAWRLTQGFTS